MFPSVSKSWITGNKLTTESIKPSATKMRFDNNMSFDGIVTGTSGRYLEEPVKGVIPLQDEIKDSITNSLFVPVSINSPRVKPDDWDIINLELEGGTGTLLQTAARNKFYIIAF